jgi:serine/threonine protein phosphatase PrpC
MICAACGTENREGARFCRGCGRNLARPDVDKAEVKPGTQVEVEAGAEVQAGGEAGAEAVAEVQAKGEAEPEAVAEAQAGDETGVQAAAEVQAKGEAEPEPEAVAEVETKGEVQEEAENEAEDRKEAEEPEAAVAPPLPGGEEDVVGFWREEEAPLVPAEPGTMVAGRYVLVDALDVQDDEILYLARDLQKCWQCGFEGNTSDDAFCAQCGASLERKPDVHLVEVRSTEAEPSGGEAIRLEHEGRHFYVVVEPQAEAKPEAPPKPESIRLLVGQRSDPGLVRELDEDSLLALSLAPTYESRTGPVLGLFAVADGMGGHEAGEIASKLALQVLTERVLQTIVVQDLAGDKVMEDDVVAQLREATVAANDAVFLARQKAGNDMGTTLTAIYIRDNRLFLAHVGDCRAYRWNADGLVQLTTDHSVVASMIASGRAAPEEIYTHPQRSVIYRCVGDKPTVEVDTGLLSLAPGERLVLCCDGLWEMIRDEGIADVMMQEADPQVACDVMVQRANLAGGDDNISVIVVQVEAS